MPATALPGRVAPRCGARIRAVVDPALQRCRSMGPPVLDTGFAISAKSLGEVAESPGSALPLPEPLQVVALEPELRARSALLLSAFESAADEGEIAEWICMLWRGACVNDRHSLRCLMSLLEVRLSGVELLRRAIGLGELLRACRLEARQSPAVRDPTWRNLVDAARASGARVGVNPREIHAPEAARTLRTRARELLDQLVHGRLQAAELAWFTEIAELEMRATALRLGDLAERVGACDGRRISRLLPVLSKHEERIRDTRALLVKLPAPQELVRRAPVLLARLEDKGYDAIVRELARRPDGAEPGRAMILAAWRAPLGAELAFFGGVTRILADRLRGRAGKPMDPARAVLLTLQAFRPQGLAVELGVAELRSTQALWDALGMRPTAGSFTAQYDAGRHDRFLPDDGTPELSTPGSRPVPDLRRLVLSNIQNEHVICGLLQTPRVASLPGLVEQIVIRTRSLKVLLDVANRRELHTGAANRNVPRALLWHPSGVPVSALRKFIHVRFVDRIELASIATRGSRARPEIRQMAAAYLNTLLSG